MSDTHDHTKCCGPESPWAARQWLLRADGVHGTHAYRWRSEMRPGGAGYVELLNGYDARSMADAVLCERPQVNAVALRWDHNRQGMYR